MDIYDLLIRPMIIGCSFYLTLICASYNIW